MPSSWNEDWPAPPPLTEDQKVEIERARERHEALMKWLADECSDTVGKMWGAS